MHALMIVVLLSKIFSGLTPDGWLVFGLMKAGWLFLWFTTNVIYFVVGAILEEEFRYSQHKHLKRVGLYLLFVAFTLCFSNVPVFNHMIDIFVFEATAVCFLGTLIAVCVLPAIGLMLGYNYCANFRPKKNDLDLFVKEIPERLGRRRADIKKTVRPENDHLAQFP